MVTLIILNLNAFADHRRIGRPQTPSSTAYLSSLDFHGLKQKIVQTCYRVKQEATASTCHEDVSPCKLDRPHPVQDVMDFFKPALPAKQKP